MNQLKAVFLTKLYCLMIELRGSATLSHIKLPVSYKVLGMGKKTSLADFDGGTILGSKKVDNTRQKNINYDLLLLCWIITVSSHVITIRASDWLRRANPGL